MKATQEKVREALLLLKAATDEVEKHGSKMSPIYTELATSFACLCRARRLMLESEAGGDEVPA